ncbi:MAG: cyclopropane-fatty-acyl-phospholipid synthase [Rhodobacterales bacterium]|nr:MAG: cyclopropane-fatty-acyl-phospholipid synthase [Rhodobacterales bacterium]PIE10080.1 MAG: cyclopropane-fatty-acyl-phospholipid synthase [Rhodobacterales bacterium]
MQGPEHIAGVTTHARRGAVQNAFRYGVDYVLIDPGATSPAPFLFSRNRFNLASVYDRDHGGPMKQGRGLVWLHEVLSANGLDPLGLRVELLTQPRFLGYSFNPVSFWLVWRGAHLVAVVAEVSTPFGDRHSYLCHQPDFAPITAKTRIDRPKALHVSPFQEVAGRYHFTYDIRPERIAIRIDYRNGDKGLIATLSGPRAPLTNPGLLAALIRRPLGALRTIILIHWQALRLKLKGARYRRRPEPPENEVT